MASRRHTHLVLTRKQGEAIEFYAGGELLGTITLDEIHQNFIRSSYDMDERVHVCRKELPEDVKLKAGIQRRKRAAIMKAISVLAALLCCGGCIAPSKAVVEVQVAGQVVKVDLRK